MDHSIWQDFSFVASSGYRERVLAALAGSPKLPKQLSSETHLRLNHVSRALRELRQRGLVVCLTPEAKARGRLYGMTDAGWTLFSYLNNSRERFVRPTSLSVGATGFVPKIRAALVVRFLHVLEGKYGSDRVREALDSWAVDPDALTDDNWLSADSCAELFDIVESKFGDGSYRCVREASAQVAPTVPTVLEQLAKALPLEALAEFAPVVYAKEWNYGRLEVETGRRRAVFRHFDWMPTPGMCALFHGAYEGIVRSRGLVPRVTKSRCVQRGDGYCEYIVEW